MVHVGALAHALLVSGAPKLGGAVTVLCSGVEWSG